MKAVCKGEAPGAYEGSVGLVSLTRGAVLRSGPKIRRSGSAPRPERDHRPEGFCEQTRD